MSSPDRVATLKMAFDEQPTLLERSNDGESGRQMWFLT